MPSGRTRIAATCSRWASPSPRPPARRPSPGADFAEARNPSYLQPFVGYVKTFGPRLYVQGFAGINVPTDPRVVTMLYNDLGVGYFLQRAEDPDAWLSSVVPSMEVHVNTPLNQGAGSAT